MHSIAGINSEKNGWKKLGAYTGHIKYQQVHGNKPMSGTRSISQLQTWISTIKLVEKYETAN